MDPSSTEGSPKALNATPLEDDATRRRLREGTLLAAWRAECRLNHFDIVRYLAERDSGTYADKQGWDFYRDLALGTPDGQPYPLL
jgi:hypothetical protein